MKSIVSAVLRVGLVAGAVEGSARLFQPIILGLIGGLFITAMVVSIYRGLSYLLD